MLENAISKTLFSSYLGLFTDTGDIKIDETCAFLQMSRAELAEAFGLTSDQLRPDRIANKTKERLKDLAGAMEFVAKTFDGNIDKTKAWFNAPNLNFGGTSPKNLILKGRANKVIKFILAAQEGY